MPLRFGFVTCVQLGLSCMEEIYRIGGKLELVITLHVNLFPKKSGRIYVNDFCDRHSIPVVRIRNVNDPEAIQSVHEHDIDWLFIIGWSQIAGTELLQAPRRGVLGMHPTLLPEGRGRAAIPWAILKGLTQTGVTLFKLDEGVDTGPIIAQETILIRERETAASLYERVEEAHVRLLAKTWDDLVNDRLTLKPQDESKASEWAGRKPADGQFFVHQDCWTVDRLVRATTRPYPGAFLIHQGTGYTVWAGIPHVNRVQDMPLIEDHNHHLWIRFSDGCFQATDWEVRQ